MSNSVHTDKSGEPKNPCHPCDLRAENSVVNILKSGKIGDMDASAKRFIIRWGIIIMVVAGLADIGWFYALNLRSDYANAQARLQSEINALNAANETQAAELVADQKRINSLESDARLYEKDIDRLYAQIDQLKHGRRLDCLDNAVIGKIRRNAETIETAYQECKTQVRGYLGEAFSKLDDNDLYLVFASLVAYQLAPYGDSDFQDFEDILYAPKMNCAQYTLAVGYFASLRAAALGQVKIRFVGWYGGAVSNHAQVFTENPVSGVSLMLDPTIGVVALGSFNDIASGKPLDPAGVADFSTRVEQQNFRERVIAALLSGGYKPSDLLYYYDGMENRLRSPEVDYLMTPAGILCREDGKCRGGD
jgi:hypothetical protein